MGGAPGECGDGVGGGLDLRDGAAPRRRPRWRPRGLRGFQRPGGGAGAGDVPSGAARRRRRRRWRWMRRRGEEAGGGERQRRGGLHLAAGGALLCSRRDASRPLGIGIGPRGGGNRGIVFPFWACLDLVEWHLPGMKFIFSCFVYELQVYYVLISEANSGFQWRGTFVYGEPRMQDRHLMWELIRRIAPISNAPWLVMGDFNETMWSFEHFSARQRPEPQTRDFRDVLFQCDLHDISFVGLPWTYDNKQKGDRNVRV